MTQQSFRSMLNDKIIGKADLLRVTHDKIQIEPGFNERHDRAELQEHIQQMIDFMRNGGELPPLMLDANLQIRDGHCRYHAYGERIRLGEISADHPIYFMPFRGTDADAIAVIASSNNGLPLTPLERSRVYARLQAQGLSNADIAGKVGRSRAHVDQMLLLASSSAAVQGAVSDGKISATEAVKIQRDHGENAQAEIERREQVARELGKEKVTAAAAKPKKAVKLDSGLAWAVRSFVSAIPDDVKAQIILGSVEFVEVDAGLLAELIQAAAEIPADDGSAGGGLDGQAELAI